MTLPDGLADLMFAENSQGVNELLLDVKVAETLPDLEIVYVQPVSGKGDELSVSFEQFAKVVERESDPMSQRFAESLRRWARDKAGELGSDPAREEDHEKRKQRHGDMSGIAVTLPDGSRLEVDAEGKPTGFSAPTKPAEPAES